MLKHLLLLVLSLTLALSASAQDELDQYVARLKQSKATGGSETAFMSIGNEFLYGQEYFENKNYSSAESYFKNVLYKDPNHAFANYQLGVALARQHDPEKKKAAQQYFAKAFEVLPSLKSRYALDFPEEKTVKTEPKVAPAPPAANPGNAAPGLENYIQRLKSSRAAGGAETAMNSVGRDVLYAVEYYDANAFDSAELGFRLAVGKEPENIYANYLLAVSLAAQGKNDEAKPYLSKAIASDAALSQRFAVDVKKAAGEWQKIIKAKEVKTKPAEKIVPGGKLAFGNYTCHQTIYNGPNTTPAFSNLYKGYFALRANGMYRWLDDGGEGRYSYDSGTGKVTWLSGHLAGQKAQLTTYKISGGYGQMTIKFNDNYRWECGCKIQ